MTFRCLVLFAVSAALLLGEPKYEMGHYVMGLLRRGPNAGTGDQAERERIQEGHLANITVEEAKAMTDADPAIKASCTLGSPPRD